MNTEAQHTPGAQETVQLANPGPEKRLRQMGEQGRHPDEVKTLRWIEAGGIRLGKQPIHAVFADDEIDGLFLDLGGPDVLRRNAQTQEAQQAPVTTGEIQDLQGFRRGRKKMSQDLLGGVVLLQGHIEVLAQGLVDLVEVLQRMQQHLIAGVDAGLQPLRPHIPTNIVAVRPQGLPEVRPLGGRIRCRLKLFFGEGVDHRHQACLPLTMAKPS
jgi:hypothetical protein